MSTAVNGGVQSARIVVLAKPPQRGRAKSRLAADVGEATAARLARAMLVDTWSATAAFAASPGAERSPEEQSRSCCDDHEPSPYDVALATTAASEAYPLLCPAPTLVDQGSGDLGTRMARLLRDGLAEAEAVLLLGSDSPGLPPEHLSAALHALCHTDVVLGPCENGGFWCLGLSRSAQADRASVAAGTWLDQLDWSGQDMLPAVEARLDELGLRFAHAPDWFDVDHGSDLPRLTEALDESPHRAPRTRHELARETDHDRALVSLIVSTLDEGLLLDTCCAALAAQPGPVEIIVADGGSKDGSVERVRDLLDVTVVRSAPGRGRQFAAGAALATGDVLAFVHVDTRLPGDATDRMRAALSEGRAEAGAFVTRTVPDPDLPDRAGPLLRLADLRSRFTRHPYGDQALFMTAAAHAATGGFRPLPIMEDYDLSVRLARRAPIARIDEPVLVSGRRIQLHPVRSALLMRLIPPLYRLGVSPDRLARWYHRS
jgi:rSAM/selenodomain-associated transferase 2